MFKKLPKENNRPNRQKFAQSGHPVPILHYEESCKKYLLYFPPKIGCALTFPGKRMKAQKSDKKLKKWAFLMPG
jgi:hypothetical protein